jgi:hypothetical protein
MLGRSSALAEKLGAGASLDHLASAAGVSHDDLVAALEANAPGALQSSADFDAISESIAGSPGKDRPSAGIRRTVGQPHVVV